MGLYGFIVVAFVLGFFMSLGKAAVFKHIPVYYPTASERSAVSSASWAGWAALFCRLPSAC